MEQWASIVAVMGNSSFLFFLAWSSRTEHRDFGSFETSDMELRGLCMANWEFYHLHLVSMENKKIGAGLWLRFKYIDECFHEVITNNWRMFL